MNGNHRGIVILCGTREWSHATVITLIGHHPHNDILWAGDTAPAELDVTPLARRQQLLGDEYGVAIIDAWSGFDPDQFGALSGTIRGGGALLVLAPPLSAWPAYPDPALQRISVWPHSPSTMPNRFIERLIRVLHRHPAVTWISQGEPVSGALTIAPPHQHTHSGYHTNDQQRAIEAIHHLMSGHRRRPLVLMADRGRGKSSAMGFAAAELIRNGTQRIIVTAPHRNAVTSLLAHAASHSVEFIPPDELLRHPVSCDLLLVDEAAAIPSPLLAQLLQHYSRIVFATTVHGYEGCGRGFALRFFKTLDAMAPSWRLLEMHEPIRWADDDPLERLTYDLLLLDAIPAADEEVSGASIESVDIEIIDPATLAEDETLLTELFGLLVLAHYRTTPLDLRLLLDSPNLSIHVARYRNRVAGIALTLREGGFDPGLAAQIYSGRRRPRGHLAPQSLAFHCGMHDAPSLVTERIMRIAVHPAAQHRGIGTALIQAVARRSEEEDIDYLSTSFGATPELLRFWQRNHLLPIRIGLTREASSGARSGLLMRPLSPSAMTIFARSRKRFLTYLPVQLSDSLRDLDSELTVMLLSDEVIEHSPSLDNDDWRDLYSFAYTQRSYESCIGAISKLCLSVTQDASLINSIGKSQYQLLIAKVIQKRSWSEVSSLSESYGKHDTLTALRIVLQSILIQIAPAVIEHFDRESALSE